MLDLRISNKRGSIRDVCWVVVGSVRAVAAFQ